MMETEILEPEVVLFNMPTVSRGRSKEAQTIQSNLECTYYEFRYNSNFTVDISEQLLKTRFEFHKCKWEKETGFYSDPDLIVNHLSYQTIIAMGKDIIPFILRDWVYTDNFWFVALEKITGINPINPDDYGDVMAMKDAWNKWFSQNKIE